MIRASGPSLDDRLHVPQEGPDLGCRAASRCWRGRSFARGVGLAIPQARFSAMEVVVAHPQAVARHAGIDGIGAVGEGIAQVLNGSGGG